MYIGQYEWLPGQIDTFETAIGRPAAWFSRYGAMEINDDGFPEFFPADAEAGWREGKILIVNAIETIPNPYDNPVSGFTVDKLCSGVYDSALTVLADSFRVFGKPMFFNTAREPLGIGSGYMGGFGAKGDLSLEEALQNDQGLAEFDPSGFPNAFLYADLGDNAVSDGVERLVAAQRYYHHFFVTREGLEFLTFETMGWPIFGLNNVTQAVEEILDESPGFDSLLVQSVIESSYDFANYYPGDNYVDWVSINFYTLDYYADDWPGLENDYLVSTRKYLDDFDYNMSQIRNVAPGKPVFFLELGFPDGKKKNSARAASRIDSCLNHFIANYPEINGISMWSWHPAWFDSTAFGYFPFDCLIRPGTQQTAAFRQVIDNHPGYFHSCVYFSDGSQIPTCSVTGIESEQSPASPTDFSLEQNYPNPFNPETALSYQLPAQSDVRLDIYNSLGQKVRTLENGRKAAGRYILKWDGRDDAGKPVTSGVYLYRLQAGKKFARSRKMLLLR